MTQKAIELLSINKNGFFLLVEGGKIDHAHHASNARRSLDEFVKFDEAIGLAMQKTSEADTLLVVTADHSHEFNIGGYGVRGNPLFGILHSRDGESMLSESLLTYTPLVYGNGPGALKEKRKTNLTDAITMNKDYLQESAVHLKSESHGGEDVAIYSRGPMSYLLDGTVEQNYITHAMAYSAW